MTFQAVLIAGPTASGKSAAALALARQIDGVVINADSMQVYREAPILTAQPSPADQAGAPHLLYGHVAVRDVYSVGRWRDDAVAALAQARAMGRMPIFVGGTGMYFMALTQGLAEVPAIPADVRADARTLLDQIGVAALHARLAARDPVTAAKLRPTDPQRTLRAWEVLQATGRSLADWQAAPAQPLLTHVAGFVLNPQRESLRAAIARRFEQMLGAGALEEARALAGLEASLPAAKILGLRPLQALAAGEITQEQALETAITTTRQFAKRQMTWFRHRMAHHLWLETGGNIISKYAEVSV